MGEGLCRNERRGWHAALFMESVSEFPALLSYFFRLTPKVTVMSSLKRGTNRTVSAATGAVSHWPLSSRTDLDGSSCVGSVAGAAALSLGRLCSRLGT